MEADNLRNMLDEPPLIDTFEFATVGLHKRIDNENSLFMEAPFSTEDLTNNLEEVRVEDCFFDFNNPKVFISFRNHRIDIDQLYSDSSDVAYEVLKILIRKNYLSFK